MIMNHYVIVLTSASKQNDFNKASGRIQTEGSNAARMHLLITNTMKNENMSSSVKKIEILGNSPVLYIECTEKAIQRILDIDGIDAITDDGRYTNKAKKINKHPKFFDGFKKRKR